MRKGILISIVIAILSVILFQVVLAENLKEKNIYIELQDKIKKFDPKNEVVRLRTEHRRTFKDKNGKMVTFISTEPLNYRDDDNQLQPIELNLASEKSVKVAPRSFTPGVSSQQRPAGNGFRYKHHALKNSVKARFAETSDGGIMLEYQNRSIEFKFNHQTKRPAKVDKNKVRYKKIFSNCDLEYTVLPGTVKDELIFYSVPQNPVLSFAVDFGDLKPQNGPEGSINLVDGSGEVIFTINPSIMFEKENEENGKIIETRFHRQGTQLYCDLILDMAWLKDKNRKYPVVVDPQVSIRNLYTEGKSNQRFLLYTPASYGTVECDIKIEGPGWHGHLSKYNDARGHFKDLTASKTFLEYSGIYDYHKYSDPVNAIAGHYYEVAIYGGRAKHKIGGKKFPGQAWATIKYGDNDGYLFPKDEIPPVPLFAKVHRDIVEKVFEVNYFQTVSYTSNSTFGFQVFEIGDVIQENGEPVERIYYTPNSNKGSFQLNKGKYKILVPQNAWAEFNFPRLTANYESRILMRSNPGVIDSTFMLPTAAEVKMQFKTERNGEPSGAYPFVKIMSGIETIYERKFDVNHYNYFDGGDKRNLEKEVPYRLIISRGEGMSGWGSVELELFHPKNQPCSVTDLRLIDDQNNPNMNGYANGNHRLCFNYSDPDDNPLKEYKLTIEQTNSTKKYEYWLNPTDLNDNIVNIPYLLRQFKFDNGGEILCRVDAWDGFDFLDMSKDYHFTLDLAPPVVDQFKGEVSKVDNSLTLECQVRDLLSGIKSNQIFWKVDGQLSGSKELSQSESITTIPNLPVNSRVEVVLEAVDNTGNKTTRTEIFYTYPEKATLLAPVDAISQKKAELKISKAAASFFRVERYRKNNNGNLSLDYDTGYLDPTRLGQSVVGNPQVSLTAPADGSIFDQPAEIFLSADAFDVDGSIAKVIFYAGSKYIGTVTSRPYNFTWRNVTAGNYQITARAIDNDGLETVSAPVSITVRNSLPTVIITSPKNDQTFYWPANVTITADAIDSDGSIVKVDFYSGTTLIGTVTKSPYSINWNNVPIGSYNIIAKATDNNGDVGSAIPIKINVTPPPIQPYRFNFDCSSGSNWKGVRNLFRVYLPANKPAPGSYSYKSIGKDETKWINTTNDVSTIPCKIRVAYTVYFSDSKDDNRSTPYFRVTLNNGKELVYKEFYNGSRSGTFEIPANSYVRIDWNSGHREDEHDFPKDDEQLGFNGWYSLNFEYILDDQSSFSNLSDESTVTVHSLSTTNEPIQNGLDNILNSEPVQLVYSLPEPQPAQKHETYIYRIYTKNGDKEVWQDSQPVLVLNNPPEILAMEPLAGITTYSYQTFKFKMYEVVDRDDDRLTYTYRISGKKSTGEDYTYEQTRNDQGAVEVTGLPDGNYTWTVEVKDEYEGLAIASGKLIVDKTQPIASFNINGGNRFTNERQVTVKVDETYNVYRIRFSYDNINWFDPISDWTEPIGLKLPAGEGVKTIYLQAQTEAQAAAGEWGPPVSVQRSIILDTTPPETTHFTIFNQGGTDSVYFRWGGGNDDLSGIAGYNVQYRNGLAWTDIEPDDNRVYIPATGYNTPVKIRVRLLDQAGNKSDWVEAVGYTKAAPGSLNLAETTSGYNTKEGHYIHLKLNPAQGATGYKLICTENSGGGDTVELDTATLSYRDTGLVPHGTYQYKLQTFNSSGEITEVELEPIQIVNIRPEKPIGLAPQGFISKIKGIALEFDRSLNYLDPDGDPLDVKYYLSTDNITYIELPNEILNDLNDGSTYYWKAGISDGFGETVETDPVSFTVDATPPVINVDNLAFGWAWEHRVRIEATDNGSGIASITVNGVPTSSTYEIVLNKHGANLLTVTATDQAGNMSSFSHIYYVDQTQPVTSNVRFDLPQSNGKYLAGTNLIPAVWEGSDPETGINQFRYVWSDSNGSYDPNNMQSVVLMDQQGTYRHNFIGSFEDGETYYLYIQPENRLGIKGPIVQSAPVFYDHTRPILKIGELSGGRYFNGLYYLANLKDLNLIVESSDPHSGISKLEYALTETTSPETIQWFSSLDLLKTETNPVEGQTYYLAISATNGTGLSSIEYTEPFIIDQSAPLLTVTAGSEQKDNRIYQAQVITKDPETMVVKLEYAIGSTPGATDLSMGLPGADAKGWINLVNPAERMEIRQYAEIRVGTIYYFTVKAYNITGGVTTVTTSGTKVIANDAPIVRDDGNFTSESESLHFEWTYPNNPETIKTYEYQIRSEEGLVKAWSETRETSILVNGLQLQHNLTYYCDVRAIFESGSISPIGTSDGILVDLTPPTITEFNYPAYSIGNGIDLTWAANDPESGVKCYAGIGTNPGETLVTKGWIDLGNLKQFRISQDTTGTGIWFEHGRKYYLTLLVENSAGKAVQQISTAITIDRTAPDPPIVIDEGNYTNRNDQLKFTWKWPLGDAESGIREYQYALTTERSISGGEEWYSNELSTEVIVDDDDYELLQGGTYYLAVKAINNAGAESIGFSDGILIDVTAPTPPIVVDHGDFSRSNNTLEVSMVASDAESGVAEYRLSLGTIENPGSIINNQSVLASGGVEQLKLTGLNLEEGQVYYFTISAINHAGIVSMSSTSDGIMVDTKLPEVERVTVKERYLTDPTQISFDWQTKPTPSGISDAQYAISENPNGVGLEWQPADLSGSQTVSGLNLIEGKTYYVYVRVQNRALAENTPSVWSTPARSNPIAIDTTPPEILSIHAPALMPRRFLLQWEARDETSGIAEYRYAIGSYRGGTDVTDGWVFLVTDKTTVSFYRDDLALYDNHDYYISVAAKNGAGLWSPVYKSGAIKTELTPPVISNLTYASNYINIQDRQNGIQINWAADDEQSGIAAYRIKLVTVKDNQDLDTPAVLTNQTSGVIHLTDFNITDGQTYYIAFQAQNGIGAWSEVKYSAEILADLTPPVVSVVKELPEFVTNDGLLSMTWRVSEASNITYRLTYPNGHMPEPGTIQIVDEYSHQFTLPVENEGIYSLVLEPVDLAGNPGVVVMENIRLNAKPIANPGPERRVFKGKTVAFEPEVSDSDGTVVEYFWDFGNGETSTEVKPSCSYRELGTYTVTLKVRDNDGKWSEPGITHVTVTNTASGEMTMDEDWEGEANISGDLTVPKGITLRLKPGTKMDFTGKYKVLVYGKILIEGTAENPIVIGANTDAWDGIRLINAEAGSVIRYAEIHSADAGLVVSESELLVENSLFKGNRIGLHILNAAPTVKSCIFEENLIYGVKEDDQAAPTVKDCRFINNLTVDYYEDELGIIDVKRLNELGENDGNSE